MPQQRINWAKIRTEYVTNRASTYASLAEKFGSHERTVRWHGERERWRDERQLYCLKVADNLSLKAANYSAASVAELNQRQLARSAQLRALLESQLYVSAPDGKVAPRLNLSISEIARSVMAFSLLFKIDRLALGVDTAEPPRPRNRLETMDDDELLEELKRVRAATILQ